MDIMKKHIFLVGAFLLCLSIVPWSQVSAGTTGKITGRVLDAQGQPLPGVNVVLEGTRRGTNTDADGYYVILSVDPGGYSVTASMVGYRTESKTDVNVQADMTTDVNFTLRTAELQLGELVVRAKRPPVEVDKTSTKYSVSADQIQQLPIVRSTNEMVSLQPGVSLDGSNRMRGGNNPADGQGKGVGGDVAIYVDGVRLVTSDGAGDGYWTAVNRSVVQEISVVTGGMNAEYGNAQAGVISVVTKDGGNHYHAWSEYRFHPAAKQHWGANVYYSPMQRGHMDWGNSTWENETDPLTGRLVHQPTDYTGVTGHEFEANFSGPLSKGVSFIVSGKTSMVAAPYPSATSRGFFTDTGKFVPATSNFQGSYAVTFHPTDNVKVKVGGVFQRYNQYIGRDSDTYRPDGRGPVTGVIRGTLDDSKNIFLPADWSAAGKQKTLDNVSYVAITHSLSPRTFYDLRLSWFSTTVDTSGLAPTTTDVQTDEAGWFAVNRQIRQYEVSSRQRYQLKLDLGSQVSKGHFIKAGVELLKYNMWLTRFTQASPQSRRIEFAGAGSVPGKAVKPLYMAFYVQDKMEFQGMVVNAGVRFDWFDPVTKMPELSNLAFSPMYDSVTRFQTAPMKDPRILRNLSPRFGVSHPITANATVHFFSGMFLAYPDIYFLYNGDWLSSSPDQDWNGNGVIDPQERYNTMAPAYPQYSGFGNIDIRPEKTISFEVGYDWNFVSDYVGGLSMYYKSARDQYHYYSDQRFYAPHIQGWVYPYARQLRNNGFEEQRGLELSLRKSFSHNFSFNLSYNMTWAQTGWGNYDAWFTYLYPDSTYIASGRYWFDYTIQGGREVPVPLTQDQIQTIGHLANEAIRSRDLINGQPGGRGYEVTQLTAKQYGLTGDAFDLEHLHVWSRGYYTGLSSDSGDIRNMGSLQVLYSTPGDFGPMVNLFGSRILGNWRVNMIWRMENTGSFWYTPPNQGRERRLMPIRTWTDLSIEKAFPIRGNRGDVSFFLEVRNLFNQQDDSSYNTDDWTNWGLLTARPDNSDYVNYGDVNDQSYYGNPRQIELGLRASF